MELIKRRIQGIVPLIMHSNRLANPLDPITKQSRALKRPKTDDEILQKLRLEFMAGLYMSEGDGPVIPGMNLEAMMHGKR